MKEIFAQLSKKLTRKVIVVGDIMLDEYVIGTVNRVSPEAPIPVVHYQKKEWQLGGAGNVASNCRKIGFQVHLIALVNAHDDAGKKIIALLHDVDVPSDLLISLPQYATICKQRITTEHQQCLRVDYEQKVQLSDAERLLIFERFENCLTEESIVLISDYGKGLVDAPLVAAIVKKARACGALVLADPKGPHFDKYYGVSYLKPNEKEFYEMVHFLNIPEYFSLIEQARAVCQYFDLQGIIITQGAKGIIFVSSHNYCSAPAVSREVYDLTGAGDTVLAFLALAFAQGLTMLDALRLANEAASIAVAHKKTYAVGINELKMYGCTGQSNVIPQWELLQQRLKAMREAGKKIVFTNGCFDIIHAGHVHLLQAAAAYGDVLIVAINSDASVRRLNKGSERPLNNVDDRAAVLAAFKVVDFVTVFEDNTPLEIIKYLQPDVLVKGGDYTIDRVVGADVVISYGGVVHIIDYIPGYSTSSLVNKVRAPQVGSLQG